MFIDEKIAELEKAKRAFQKEAENRNDKNKAVNEETSKLTQKEVNEAINSGVLNIKNRKFQFIKREFLEGIVKMPMVENYLETISDTRENLVLKHEGEGVSILINLIPGNNIATNFKKGMEENFKNMGLYIEWLEEDKVEKEGGKSIEYFTFLTPTGMGKVYNIIFFYEIEGSIIIGNFNCMESKSDIWGKIFKGMIELITL